jgi:hypothetical protein
VLLVKDQTKEITQPKKVQPVKMFKAKIALASLCSRVNATMVGMK